MPDYSSKLYRPPTLAEVQAVIGDDLSNIEALDALPDEEADWIHGHATIAVYGKPAFILTSAYCEAIDCERYTTTTFAFCKDCWFKTPLYLQRRLESGWTGKRDTIGCKLYYQATLYDCVVSLAEMLDRSDPVTDQRVRDFIARRKVIRGALHRHFEGLKPPKPRKPRIFIEYGPKEGRRNYAALVKFDSKVTNQCDGVAVSCIPFTPKYLAAALRYRGMKADIDRVRGESEAVRRKAAIRYTDSLEHGNLRPVHFDETDTPTGLRAFDTNAFYVSGKVKNGVCVRDGDVIVVGIIEGYEDVRYEYELAAFLVWGGWDVFVDGDPFTLADDYAADFMYRGQAVKGKSYPNGRSAG